jgi:hypothetical protein
MSRGYDKPVWKKGRAYSLDRSFGQKGFWEVPVMAPSRPNKARRSSARPKKAG